MNFVYLSRDNLFSLRPCLAVFPVSDAVIVNHIIAVTINALHAIIDKRPNIIPFAPYLETRNVRENPIVNPFEHSLIKLRGDKKINIPDRKIMKAVIICS